MLRIPQNMIKAMTHFVMAYFVWSEEYIQAGRLFRHITNRALQDAQKCD